MSGASTMRNAIKRVTHKERAQPSDRKRHGLLEKHKDYVERAHDYKRKQATITKLRRKALERNPDEFYYKMNSSQVRKGVHRENRASSSLGAETLNLLKTQDLGYITAKKSADDAKIRKLKSNLHLIGEQNVKKHKIFLDSVEAVDKFDAAAHFNTAPELVNRSFNRPRLLCTSNIIGTSTGSTDRADEGDHRTAEASGSTSLQKPSRTLHALIDPRNLALSVEGAHLSRRNRTTVAAAAAGTDGSGGSGGSGGAGSTAVPAAYKELRERVKRSRKLKKAMHQLVQQRHLTNSKGTKRKITISPPSSSSATTGAGKSKKEIIVYKWKKQRAS